MRRALGLLGGSWVVISGVISPLIWSVTIVTLLTTPLITTHEPPSRNFEGTLGIISVSLSAPRKPQTLVVDPTPRQVLGVGRVACRLRFRALGFGVP